jgi:hypothetical protein
MKLLVAACLVATALGCSSQQDVGDANKPVPAGLGTPGAPARGSGNSAPSSTPSPGAIQTPK